MGDASNDTASNDPAAVDAATADPAAPTASTSLRWELGDSVGLFIRPAAPGSSAVAVADPAAAVAPRKVDVKPKIRGLVGKDLQLVYPPFDAASAAAPAETRAYWIQVGGAIPATPADWLTSSVPYVAKSDPVPPAGVDPYALPAPEGLEGHYLVQVLCGYNDAAI